MLPPVLLTPATKPMGQSADLWWVQRKLHVTLLALLLSGLPFSPMFVFFLLICKAVPAPKY